MDSAEEQFYNQYAQQGNFQKIDGKDPDFLRWFLDNKEGIENVKYNWKGYERDDKGNWQKTEQSDAKRMMNDNGIHWATSLMENYLDRVFQSTDWNEFHMNYEMRKAYRSVWFGLITQFKQFELSKVNTQVVANTMLARIHAMLASARAEGIRDLLKSTHNINEIRQMQPDDNRGFFSGISSIFKGRNNNPPGGMM